MTSKSCAVGMRNTKLRNHLKEKRKKPVLNPQIHIIIVLLCYRCSHGVDFFSIECWRPTPKKSLQPITNNTENQVNQSKRQVILCCWCKAREYWRKRFSIGLFYFWLDQNWSPFTEPIIKHGIYHLLFGTTNKNHFQQTYDHVITFTL